ncbi:MAG: DNA primase [Immundisolibacter sp.]|uniref:DNA primase n=1 Tax=Immundisolibacter sp. TaxID=1934948 RepID=UPI003EDEB332
MAAPARLPRTTGDHPADRLLSRLDRVKQTGPDRWLARCPAHDDKGPSLSIRELPDSRLLVHCFAQCPAGEVLAAVDLTLSDLFPEPLAPHLPPERRPFPALDVLRAVAFELRVAFIGAATVLAGEPLSATDFDRLHLALERIDAALCIAEGVRRG